MNDSQYINLKEDMHVHSTFSDGKHSILENLVEAQVKGIERICCVDHVRRDTKWVQAFVHEVSLRNQQVDMQVFSGLEAKILNQHGELDVPSDYAKADFLFAADHQFPLYDKCYTPKEVIEMRSNGLVTNPELIECYIESFTQMVSRYENIVIAHLFSIFPKIGVHEKSIPVNQIQKLANACIKNGAKIEIDERWKCPNARTLEIFARKGVEIFSSSDSHIKKNIGKYTYNAQTQKELNDILA